MIFQRSPNVPPLSDYRDYRDRYLRPDFQHRCAYCLIHEQFFLEEGGGEIDHHRPLNPPAEVQQDFKRLKNVYSNLYWTCGKCNSEKGNTWPTEEQYRANVRFLDPCLEDHQEHWDVQDDGTLAATTRTGQYTIRHIRLNRRFLVTMRRRFHEKRRRVAAVERRLASSNLTPEEQVEVAELLRDDFLLNPPAFG